MIGELQRTLMDFNGDPGEFQAALHGHPDGHREEGTMANKAGIRSANGAKCRKVADHAGWAGKAGSAACK